MLALWILQNKKASTLPNPLLRKRCEQSGFRFEIAIALIGDYRGRNVQYLSVVLPFRFTASISNFWAGFLGLLVNGVPVVEGHDYDNSNIDHHGSITINLDLVEGDIVQVTNMDSHTVYGNNPETGQMRSWFTGYLVTAA